MPYANLMFDRRVVRGSNYAQNLMQTVSKIFVLFRSTQIQQNLCKKFHYLINLKKLQTTPNT